MVRNSREEWKVYQKVFDKFTNRLLFKLSSQGHFDELTQTISPGKEAVVFAASKGEDTVAVKIYRLETAGFSKMFSYIRVDPRYQDLKNRARQVIFAWVEREYRNLLLAREAGLRVPMPIVHKDHVLVMEHVGFSHAAPLLKDAPPDDPEKFAAECFEMVAKFKKAGYVHGDLSEYNILNDNEEPVFIDFSHSISVKAPNSQELYDRDMKTLTRYFTRLGVEGLP
ncbi:MAG: serine protein kinase RIO [Candidatus Woesearchaeota archaeon]|nr:serine protein kinase RIO [Candidatus Woesearchaeota archaeon]